MEDVDPGHYDIRGLVAKAPAQRSHDFVIQGQVRHCAALDSSTSHGISNEAWPDD